MTKKEELEWRKLGRAYPDTFFDNSRVRRILKKRNSSVALTAKEKFLDNYGEWVSQLKLTHIRLKRFPIFLSSFHFGLEKRGISRVSQFIYHIENYLSLIYIFRERIKRISKFIEKLAARNQCSQTDIQNLITAKDQLIASIEPLVVIRDGHTHEKNFYDIDIVEMEKYDKAGDFTSNQEEKKAFKATARDLLSIQRKKWKKDINSDIDKCEVFIGILYGTLDKLLWQIYKKL